jgi:hypothetical protein
MWVRVVLRRFWQWYERHYALNVGITATLFTLQLIHLAWLTGDVVLPRLLDESYFPLTGVLEWLILVVDYTEIPAILSTSILYVNEIRKGHLRRGLLFLLLINSQWLHLFWITDEFVVTELGDGDDGGSGLPAWLAWIAIGIDYLELPVIYDTLRRFAAALRKRRVSTFLREEVRS